MTPATARRSAGCLSELTLEELRTGDLAGSPREATVRRHLESCSFCQPRFAAISAEAIPPVSVQLQAAATRGNRSRPRWRAVGGGALAMSAAAAVVLLVLPKNDQRDGAGVQENRTKGGLTLTLLVSRGHGVGAGTPERAPEQISGEGRLRAGESMSFVVQASQPGRVMVLGLDAAPSANLYVPFDVTGAAVSVDSAAGPSVLPGSIVADAQAGDERVFAVLCAPGVALEPSALRAQAQAALVRANGRPEAVTSLGTSCAETSVLLHKDPRGP